jgi:hypothetical protein
MDTFSIAVCFGDILAAEEETNEFLQHQLAIARNAAMHFIHTAPDEFWTQLENEVMHGAQRVHELLFKFEEEIVNNEDADWVQLDDDAVYVISMLRSVRSAWSVIQARRDYLSRSTFSNVPMTSNAAVTVDIFDNIQRAMAVALPSLRRSPEVGSDEKLRAVLDAYTA